MTRLRPRHVRNLVILTWTALVVLVFMGLARVVPASFPTWVLWATGITVWMIGNIAIAVRETQKWRAMSLALDLRPETAIQSRVEWLALPDLVGERGGHNVSLKTFASGGHGRSPKTDWTMVGTALRGGGAFTMDVRSRSFVYAGPPVRGASPVTTHDAVFDAAFEMYASDPTLALQALAAPVRAALLALDEPHRTVVEGDRVEQRVRTRLLEPQRVSRHLDAVVTLAAEVERAVR